jgi:putative ABC transport system permease protein
VTQRRREIGIRLALGSDSRGIFGLVLKEGLMLLGAGVLFGLGGAFAIRRGIETQLYGVGAMDPLVLSAVAGVLALVAITACSLPARRAARINPLIALNEQ